MFSGTTRIVCVSVHDSNAPLQVAFARAEWLRKDAENLSKEMTTCIFRMILVHDHILQCFTKCLQTFVEGASCRRNLNVKTKRSVLKCAGAVSVYNRGETKCILDCANFSQIQYFLRARIH